MQVPDEYAEPQWGPEWSVLDDPNDWWAPGFPEGLRGSRIAELEATFPGWRIAWAPVMVRRDGGSRFTLGVKAFCRKGREHLDYDGHPGGWQFDEDGTLLYYFLTATR